MHQKFRREVSVLSNGRTRAGVGAGVASAGPAYELKESACELKWHACELE